MFISLYEPRFIVNSAIKTSLANCHISYSYFTNMVNYAKTI